MSAPPPDIAGEADPLYGVIAFTRALRSWQ